MPYDWLDHPAEDPKVEAAAMAGYKLLRANNNGVCGLSMEFRVCAERGPYARYASFENKILKEMSAGEHADTDLNKSFTRLVNKALSKGFAIAQMLVPPKPFENKREYITRITHPHHPQSGFSIHHP